MNYERFYRELAREIQKRDGQIGADTQAFVDQFVKRLRANGWQLDEAIETELADYLQSMQGSIRAGISSAAALAAGSMQSETVLKITERAFDERWPDGLKLSDRLWKWQDETKKGVQDVLRQGIRQGRAADSVMMDMQRAIERSHGGQRFKIVEQHADDWVTELHEAAQRAIHTPEAKKLWSDTVEEVKEHIDSLKVTGTRRAAERVLDQARKAVEKGNEELLDRATRWWIYDRQQYHLKRIARTEMATAGHKAVIESTKDDEDIIGYQWRLSASHPVTDICDYYADIDMGLGKGVWTKETVPQGKAHPHCMCLLIPRVTKIRQRGSGNYGEFLNRLPEEKRKELLPDWLRNLNQLGMPMDKMVRPDGLGPVTREMMKARLGQDKFKAASVLSRALVEPRWGEIDPRTHKAGARKTIANLSTFRDRPEVGRLLDALEAGRPVSSLDYHYAYRRYADNEPLRSKTHYNRLLDGILKGADNAIYRQRSGNHERYVVYRESDRWAAIVDAQSNGYVSGFRLRDSVNADVFGEYLWPVKALLQ